MSSNIDNQTDATSSQTKDKQTSISMDELIYGASSFYAIVKPVSLTMVLSSLAVIFINTDQSKAMGEEALGMYQAFDISDDASAATSLGLSLINALIIVTAIGVMTFVIVLLYKYRCMKCLLGYMALATTVLLMFLGGNMFTVAINKYELPIDKISFWISMYNFALVGTFAIFYQKGIPTVVNQGYLIANSTIVAWQLSYFNDWMAWSLLIMLALYDLFAVLSPCGPLKALVNLMSKKDAPTMPGLLYEAELPENATRPGQKKRNSNVTADETEGSNSRCSNNESGGKKLPGVDNNCGESIDADAESNDDDKAVELTVLHREENNEKIGPTNALVSSNMEDTAAALEVTSDVNKPNSLEAATNATQSLDPTVQNVATTHISQQTESDEARRNANTTTSHQTAVSTVVPLAIAKVYKLPITLPGAPANISIDISHPKAYLEQELTPDQLKMNVTVRFPRGGGKIETSWNQKNEPRYLVYDRNGLLKRTLVVTEDGKVMEQRVKEGEAKGSNNIKLGLGDFIFYSVLVSKAAQSGFAAFVACFLAILTGLGGTLVLLAVYHHALPALPISIFLAVAFYVLTIYSMEPWIHQMWRAPFYV